MSIHNENSHVLEGKDIILQYIKGGKGVVTLESPTGKHHTYVFKRPRESGVFSNDCLFIYCLVDKHEEYVGMMNKYGVKLTRQSRFKQTSEQFKGAKYIYRMATSDFETPMVLYHEGICSCCGRKLTDPESITRGIGPRCLQYLEGRL